MKILNDILARVGIIQELVDFFWQRKLWWLIPLVLLLLLFSLLLIFAEGTGLGPFIYTIF